MRLHQSKIIFFDLKCNSCGKKRKARAKIIDNFCPYCKKIAMKCKKCGYEWKTRSSLLMVACPSCKHTNKIVDGRKYAKNLRSDKK
jgi:Zn finger protein HypA/HybF involved in hydrogenase expression